jgi:hypothetical protein
VVLDASLLSPLALKSTFIQRNALVIIAAASILTAPDHFVIALYLVATAALVERHKSL